MNPEDLSGRSIAREFPFPTPSVMGSHVPRLLVSVRNPAEARDALAGGADIIDVKEPARGSLGRPDSRTVRDILTDPVLAGKVPLTAALGELADCEGTLGTKWPMPTGLALAKVGFSGERSRPDWRERFARLTDRIGPFAPLVPVAYADAQQADSPEPRAILEMAISQCSKYLLIDTHTKDGRRLWDWLCPAALAEIGLRCQQHQIQLAVAGSLTDRCLADALAGHARIVAVRGAVCSGGIRTSRIDRDRVRRMKGLLEVCPRKPRNFS